MLAGDVCTQRAEFLLYPLVAAVEVIDARDDRRVLGRKASKDQRGAGSDVGAHNWSALKSLDAGYDRVELFSQTVAHVNEQLQLR